MKAPVQDFCFNDLTHQWSESRKPGFTRYFISSLIYMQSQCRSHPVKVKAKNTDVEFKTDQIKYNLSSFPENIRCGPLCFILLCTGDDGNRLRKCLWPHKSLSPQTYFDSLRCNKLTITTHTTNKNNRNRMTDEAGRVSSFGSLLLDFYGDVPPVVRSALDFFCNQLPWSRRSDHFLVRFQLKYSLEINFVLAGRSCSPHVFHVKVHIASCNYKREMLNCVTRYLA